MRRHARRRPAFPHVSDDPEDPEDPDAMGPSRRLDPDDPPGSGPDDFACERTPAYLARLVAGSGGGVDPAFRAHVLACDACRASYREAMATAARLGRGVREERERGGRSHRRAELRRRAIAATGDPRRRRRFGLQLALLPAGIALLILLWRTAGGGQTLAVEWTGGGVLAAGELLGDDRPRMVLERGDWCETLDDARASLALAPRRERGFELGPRTQLCVEDPRACRVRLQRGSLVATGPALVTTSLGILRVEEGRARIEVCGSELVLESLEGELAWTGPKGERVLSAGESLSVSGLLASVR